MNHLSLNKNSGHKSEIVNKKCEQYGLAVYPVLFALNLSFLIKYLMRGQSSFLSVIIV